MADFSDLMTATRAIVDPTTSGADLAQIAQAQPSLWPQIAAHPNAYPDLLAWLDTNGDAPAKQAVAARQQSPIEPTQADSQPIPETTTDGGVNDQPEPPTPTTTPEAGIPTSATSPSPVASSPATTIAPPSTVSGAPKAASIPWLQTPKGKKILFGSLGGLVVVAVVITLIVTLIVIPSQRAAEAAAAAASASAAAQAQAEQEHQDAVAAFTSAANACTSANTVLSSAIASAQQTAQTDPATMQDPTLIDKLNQAITTAQAITSCAAPTMASDTATIQQQTTQLGIDTQAVASATSALNTAAQTVPASVQAKKDADAQAATDAAFSAFNGKWYSAGNNVGGRPFATEFVLTGSTWTQTNVSTGDDGKVYIVVTQFTFDVQKHTFTQANSGTGIPNTTSNGTIVVNGSSVILTGSDGNIRTYTIEGDSLNLTSFFNGQTYNYSYDNMDTAAGSQAEQTFAQLYAVHV